MEKWNSVPVKSVINRVRGADGKIPDEACLESAMNIAINSSSNNRLELIKLYWTDGFGWYYGDDNRIAFVIHECKANIPAKTEKGYNTCYRKALAQDIGYYIQIKNGKYTNFPKELIDLSKKYGYNRVQDCISDNLALFLLTNDKFVSNVLVDNKIRALITKLEPLMLKSDKTPSKYWEDIEIRNVMESFDVSSASYDLVEGPADLSNTGDILNKYLKNKNNGINN